MVSDECLYPQSRLSAIIVKVEVWRLIKEGIFDKFFVILNYMLKLTIIFFGSGPGLR
jgi:hypothetical protein